MKEKGELLKCPCDGSQHFGIGNLQPVAGCT